MSNNDADNALHLEAIDIRLQGTPLVAIDTRIEPGEVLTVMGPSGVGKSTLLAFIAGFLDPAFSARGNVWLRGRNLARLPAEQRRLGLLFQDPLLFPHLSVGGNLGFGLRRDHSRRDRYHAIETALAEIGLSGYADRDPATLSGGQRSRVALMRVLLSRPNAMLLDEPFSKLDTALREDMRSLVFSRIHQENLPTLMVTHDEADAEAAGGRVLRLMPPY
ncbi:ATP-binding cassette domain-containing protein [Aidingimonas halophila]|uniref:Putative thiamine transport system ATP-binding protein n=1 Tax=Aidingimonas halophila TaxID=574349 RepID=A0A1H2SAF6_9GAMM|nr:ATP-binding cassette domain-containing protein [Aidingimonas halophila]GHC17951.1 ABC transporter ATP-binding protein [Aidingimonas halophila]SDW28586.1 putative thiamine transport system ATP-binding protein [Aidingimonas halophila]